MFAGQKESLSQLCTFHWCVDETCKWCRQQTESARVYGFNNLWRIYFVNLQVIISRLAPTWTT